MDNTVKENIEPLVAIDAEIITKAFDVSVASGENAARDAILSFKDGLNVQASSFSMAYRLYVLKLMAQVVKSLNETNKAVFITVILSGGKR